jgi:MHS family proline/betaine transporter-like MFS transporter
MGNKSYLNKSAASHTQKSIEIEVPDVYSGVVDFEFSHFIGKKGKAIIAAILGTVVERYDYALYGYMAAVLSTRFFPNQDPSIAFLKHFLVFALGFIAKPLGSYIFGCIGDSFGRKYALRWSIIGIAIPTVIIGCLPSYEQLGNLAVLLLCLCRIAQGIFISAEGDGVEIFIYETLPKKRACLANSLTWLSGTGGVCLASFASGIFLMQHLPVWAWRIPFLIGGAFGLFTLWFRNNLIESYDYLMYSANKTTPFANTFSHFFKTIWQNKVKILIATLIKGSEGGVYYFYFVFWNNYMHKVHDLLSASEACFKATLLTAASTLMAPICGLIADRIGVKRTIILGSLMCIGMLAMNGVYLNSFNSSPNSLMLVTVFTLVLFSVPINVLTVKLFSIGERYRCMSMGHALGSMFISSTTPAVATLFWQKFQNPTAPLFYCCALIVTALIATCFASINNDNSLEMLQEVHNLNKFSHSDGGLNI